MALKMKNASTPQQQFTDLLKLYFFTIRKGRKHIKIASVGMMILWRVGTWVRQYQGGIIVISCMQNRAKESTAKQSSKLV